MNNDLKILEDKIRKIVLEIKEDYQDIIITIPANINWNDYKKELKNVENYSQVMNFKVPTFPKRTKVGNKCYLCYKGEIIGWMEIVGMEEKEFTCTTTGKQFKGKFVLRSGPLNYINPIKMKGFQGFRYFSEK